MTIREFLSSINIPSKGTAIDGFIPPKFIYKQAQSIIGNFLKKDFNSNFTLYKVVEGWSEIPCLNMEEVPVTSCDVGINLCQKLMRSKDRLPPIYSSGRGAIIKQCMSLNFGQDYTDCYSPNQWKAIQKRKDKNSRYFFFLDGYLYIPIPKGDLSTPETVRLEAYFKDKADVDKYILTSNNCPDCVSDCKKLLDYEMVLPYYLEDSVKTELITQIFNSKRIPLDEYPNMNSNDKK